MEAKWILLSTIACLCHKGLHVLSLCAFYGTVLRNIVPSKRQCSRWAHTESAVDTLFVTEQMTESVHTTSLWPSWNGKFGKPLFIHKLAHACIYIYINTNRQMYIQVCLFCFMPHWFCHERAHWCICRFNIDIITTVLLQQACALMLWAWSVFLHGAPTMGYCGRRN